MKQIIPPTNCPCCDSILVYRNDQLFCENIGCSAQWDKKVEHFASTLKIKGLGPATLNKLQIEDYAELYELTVSEIEEMIQDISSDRAEINSDIKSRKDKDAEQKTVAEIPFDYDIPSWIEEDFDPERQMGGKKYKEGFE